MGGRQGTSWRVSEATTIWHKRLLLPCDPDVRLSNADGRCASLDFMLKCAEIEKKKCAELLSLLKIKCPKKRTPSVQNLKINQIIQKIIQTIKPINQILYLSSLLTILDRTI